MRADDRPIVAAISRGSREAFIMIFESTADAVGAEAAARLPDARRAGTVFAATSLEVWWLAGRHCGAGIDATAWTGQILEPVAAAGDPGQHRAAMAQSRGTGARGAARTAVRQALAGLIGKPGR